jgi:hypothetical protein
MAKRKWLSKMSFSPMCSSTMPVCGHVGVRSARVSREKADVYANLLQHEHGALGQVVLAQTLLVVQQFHCGCAHVSQR